MTLSSGKGFTLIETLLTLTIVSILLAIVIPISSTQIDNIKEKIFFSTLNQDLLLVQNEAITKFHPNSLSIRETTYNIGNLQDDHAFERVLPDSYKFIGFQQRREITFNNKGSLSAAGSFSIKAKNKNYWFILPPGKGRARFEEK